MAATTIAKYKPGHDAEDTPKNHGFKPPTSLKDYNRANVEASIRFYEMMGLGTGNKGTHMLPQFAVRAYLTLGLLGNNERVYMGPLKGNRRSVMDYHQ